MKCSRCGAVLPDGVQVRYADDACDACMHVPLCDRCNNWHIAENLMLQITPEGTNNG
jgi:hypothetical protein